MAAYADSWVAGVRARVGQRLLLNPGAAVVAVRTDPVHGEQILVQRRTDRPEYWEIPSGGAEPGDSYAGTAARELAEEAGLQVNQDQLTPFSISSSQRSTYPNGDQVQGFTIGFEAHPVHTATTAVDGEATDQRWVSPDQVPSPLTPGSARQLAAWRQYRQSGQVQQLDGELAALGGPAPHGFAESYLGQLRAQIGHDLVLIPGALVLVVDPLGRVLVQRRTDTGLWELPGGSAEAGQSFVGCARAELAEETGIEAPVEGFIPIGTLSGSGCVGTYPNGDQIQSFSVVFLLRTQDSVIPGGHDGEASQAQFCAPDQLPHPITRFATAVVELWGQFERTGRFSSGVLSLDRARSAEDWSS